jgi:hypothetical protein
MALTFDKVVRTKNGFVPCIKLLPVLGNTGISVIETKKHHSIDFNNLYKIPGPSSEVSARFIGKAYCY